MLLSVCRCPIDQSKLPGHDQGQHEWLPRACMPRPRSRVTRAHKQHFQSSSTASLQWLTLLQGYLENTNLPTYHKGTGLQKLHLLFPLRLAEGGQPSRAAETVPDSRLVPKPYTHDPTLPLLCDGTTICSIVHVRHKIPT